MKQHRKSYPVRVMCRVLDVTHSGFYVWLNAVPSQRKMADLAHVTAVKAAHEQTRKTYGTRRLHKELQDQGHEISQWKVRILRKKLGLRCKQVKKCKATTNSQHNLPIAENLLDQKFEPTAPNQQWVTDITYIPTDEGWLYLAGVKDVFTCELVGYAMASRMTKGLCISALQLAVISKKPAAGLIHHSDRGSQYCSYAYQRKVKKAGMLPSMSRKGNCWDNAPMESCWGSLKNELVHQKRYATRADARDDITEYIEVFYNRQRRHSRLNDVAPVAFYKQFYAQEQIIAEATCA